jgi:hypothetical protein
MGLYRWLWWTGKQRRRQIATQAFITVLPVLFVAGWWYAQTLVRSGSLGGEQQSISAAQTSVRLIDAIFQIKWHRVADFALVSHIRLGDWSFLVVRNWMYRVLEIVLFGSLPGLSFRKKVGEIVTTPRCLWIYVVFLGVFGCAVGYQALSAYRSTDGASPSGITHIAL